MEKIKALLTEHGVDLPDFKGETLEAWLEKHADDGIVTKVLRNRLEFASAAGAKLDAIVEAAAATWCRAR